MNLVVSSEKKPKISFSQLGSWHRCEKAFDYSYKQKLRPITQPGYFKLGGIGHEMMANYYDLRKNNVTDRGELLEAHLIFVQNKLVTLGSEMVESLGRAAWLVQHYIEDFSPLEDVGHTIVGIEEEFNISLTSPNGLEYELVGIYD